ncbi:hypothetical protein E2K93_01350 [Thalassotalea sp. HSM 43]|uniref:hypothetical protein n=1 Tax=Thalassotalea sp. HSM 43 TaxID=2552945 RepID=UPI0010818615|nr:hypothetical protein [Thalassotalea sp. HSM 43]QBY03094.1 hypothetical protein E2K93_01350 [Thalassotalea sp. HSM 43]
MQFSKIQQKRMQFAAGAAVSCWLVTNTAWLATDSSSLVPLATFTLSTVLALTVFLYKPH